MKRLSMAMTALAVLGLMTMVSCRKPNVNNVVPGEARTVTFNATTESGNGSKTYLDGPYVKWNEGDKLNINGETFTLETGEGTTSGSFTGTITGSAPYLAGYPQASTTYTADPKSLKLNLPDKYTYNDSKVEIPMVATTNSEDGDLSFSNAVNVLKLKLKGNGTTASNLTSIVLQSSTSAINGDIAVTFSGATPTFEYADGTTTTTVNFTGGKQLTSAEQYVYVVLPKINSGELTIKFNCSNDKYMMKKITVTSHFNAVNNILSTPELTVNAQTEPVETDEWINFGLPEPYQNLKWAKKNLGATCSTENPTDPKTATTWYGDYYAWGEVAPYATKINWTSATSGSVTSWCEHPSHDSDITFDNDFGYGWKNYLDGEQEMWSTDYEWNPTPYGSDNILKSGYDAARQVLGGSWRMPTGGKSTDDHEWKQLKNNTYFQWTTNYMNISGLNGYIVYKVKNSAHKGYLTYYSGDAWNTMNASGTVQSEYAGQQNPLGYTASDDPHMFIPAAGYFNGTAVSVAGINCYCWSSSRNTSSSSGARSFKAESTSVKPNNWNERYAGMPVRPVK